MVADALSRMTMDSVSHVEKSKKYMVKDVHRLARLGVRLDDYLNGSFMVHHNCESSLVLVLSKLNESFSLGWMVS